MLEDDEAVRTYLLQASLRFELGEIAAESKLAPAADTEDADRPKQVRGTAPPPLLPFPNQVSRPEPAEQPLVATLEVTGSRISWRLRGHRRGRV